MWVECEPDKKAQLTSLDQNMFHTIVQLSEDQLPDKMNPASHPDVMTLLAQMAQQQQMFAQQMQQQMLQQQQIAQLGLGHLPPGAQLGPPPAQLGLPPIFPGFPQVPPGPAPA